MGTGESQENMRAFSSVLCSVPYLIPLIALSTLLSQPYKIKDYRQAKTRSNARARAMHSYPVSAGEISCAKFELKPLQRPVSGKI